MKRLTELAHDILRATLAPGDAAIDGTAGNGHDTLFLAEAVGPAGHVFAFDIQRAAIVATQLRIAGHSQVNVLQQSHDRMAELVPHAFHQRIAAVTMNLGYLPGSDHAIITTPTVTVNAVRQAYELLQPGGVITIIAYPGHDAGCELAAIRSLINGTGWCHEVIVSTDAGPVLMVICKHA